VHAVDPDVAVVDVHPLVFGHLGAVEDFGHDGGPGAIGGQLERPPLSPARRALGSRLGVGVAASCFWLPADPAVRLVLDDVSLLAAPDAEQHGVTIVRELPEEGISVKVDVDFIKQAMLNVVINGVQAMPNGGILTIAAHRDGETVVTEVRDQGGGIPTDIQDKIFELYFTTKKGGSGIGLAQTYQIMQWHYGSVEFESAPGKGTTFRLRLPIAEPAVMPQEDMSGEFASRKS